jgi:predicted metalloprotease with PDZ domain
MARTAGGVAFAALLCAARVVAQTPDRYEVRLDAEQAQLWVRACLAADAPSVRWRVHELAGAEAAHDFAREGAGALTRRGATVLTPAWRAGTCLRYRVDLATLARVGGRDAAVRHGEDWLLGAAAWLWQPRGDAARAHIRFVLPEGWSVSAPWRPLGAHAFVIGGAPPDWPATVAIGRLHQFAVGPASRRLRVAVSGAPDDASAAALHAYVAGTYDDVRRVFSHLAAASPQLTVVMLDGAQSAVPYGESQRGGVGGIVLLANAHSTREDYFGSWTLTHELTHLAHPYLGTRGRWVGEGIATYFQYVIRARAGRITPHEAWAQLHAGFGRGRADRGAGTLAEVSAELSRNHRYMRAYWSGAALALTADVRLRRRAQSASSLEAAINAYGACCLRTGQYESPRDFLVALDRAAGGDTLSALFDAYAASERFPDLTEAYAALGLDSSTGEPLAGSDAQTRALRAAIMGGELLQPSPTDASAADEFHAR